MCHDYRDKWGMAPCLKRLAMESLEWMDGRMDGRMDGWVDERMMICDSLGTQVHFCLYIGFWVSLICPKFIPGGP